MTEEKKFHHGNLKDELIEASISFVTAQKDTEISMREIANSLGVTHAAVYRHFESKNELLAAVAANGYLLLAKYLDDEFVKLKNLRPRPLLFGMLNAYIDFSLEHEGYYRVMFNRDVIKSSDEDLANAIAQSRIPMQMAIERITQKNGFRDTLLIATLPNDIWSFLHGYITLVIDGLLYDGNSPSQTPKISKQNYINLILNSILI